MYKIGILTLHFVDNYGAVIQAYSLKKLLGELSDGQVDIINYVWDAKPYIPYCTDDEAINKYKEKRKRIELFLQDKCDIRTPYVMSLADQEYDCFCVGSDQVWNLQWSQDAYFLKNAKEGSKYISYAASVGMGKTSIFWDDNKFKQYLPKFDYISLREDDNIDLFSQISGKDCKLVLDPVLMHERCFYEELIKENDELEDYLLFFWIDHEQDIIRGIDFVNTMSRIYNLSVLHSMPRTEQGIFEKELGSMIYDDIESFLSHVSRAKVIVTNSYHVTLLAMLFHIPFYTFPVNSMKSRTETLKRHLGISSRVVEGYIKPSSLTMEMDFLEMDRNIEQLKQESLCYLKMAL